MCRRRGTSDNENLAYLALGIIAIAVIVWLIVYVVLPASLIAGGIALVAGASFAFCTSVAVFYRALSANTNPYRTYTDPTPHVSGVRRGYFFGPGFCQLEQIWADSKSGMEDAIEQISTMSDGMLRKEGLFSFSFFYADLWIYLFCYASCLSLYFFGYGFTILFCFLLSAVLAVGWASFFSGYIILRLSDSIVLFLNSIEHRCPNCKRRAKPLFICPKCRTFHTLQPGPYGIFHAKCSCGEKLPTTAFNGRNDLVAVCSVCHHHLKGYAEHFGIQAVGATSSGKTTYLSAFFHEYIKGLPPGTECSLSPKKDFDALEESYMRGTPTVATTERNAEMYSITHEFPGYAPYQLSIYDIAGEAFQDVASSGFQQQQYQYSEGIILMIDPDSSKDDSCAVLSSFCTEHKKLRSMMVSQMSPVPVAIVITKSDRHAGELPEGSQDQEGHVKFLEAHGFGSVVKLISAEFIKAKYFTVSASGHEPDGTKYKPLGVLEPVMWLLGEGKSPLCSFIEGNVPAGGKIKNIFRKFAPFAIPVVAVGLVPWGIWSVPWGRLFQSSEKPQEITVLSPSKPASPDVVKKPSAGPLRGVATVALSSVKSHIRTKPTPTENSKPLAQILERNIEQSATTQSTAVKPQAESNAKPATTPAKDRPLMKLSTFGTKINVRNLPDINSDSFALLDEGVPVEAKDSQSNHDGIWYKVILPGGKEGWIRGDLLKNRIGDRGIHGGDFMRVNGDDVNIRRGPSKNSESLGKLYSGHLVEVVGRNGAWREVYTQSGEKGWVHGDYLGRQRRFDKF